MKSLPRKWLFNLRSPTRSNLSGARQMANDLLKLGPDTLRELGTNPAEIAQLVKMHARQLVAYLRANATGLPTLYLKTDLEKITDLIEGGFATYDEIGTSTVELARLAQSQNGQD